MLTVFSYVTECHIGFSILFAMSSMTSDNALIVDFFSKNNSCCAYF